LRDVRLWRYVVSCLDKEWKTTHHTTCNPLNMIAIYYIHNNKRRNKHGVYREKDKDKTRKTVKGT